jgi:hypothetical protein
MMVRLELNCKVILTFPEGPGNMDELLNMILGTEMALNSLGKLEVESDGKGTSEVFVRFHFSQMDLEKIAKGIESEGSVETVVVAR